MAAIHDTAYPRLASSLSSAELKRLYSITRKEKTWIEKQRITLTSLLDTVVYLKVFQCLGYFPPPAAIPAQIIQFIASECKLDSDNAFNSSQRLSHRIKKHVRQFCHVKSFSTKEHEKWLYNFACTMANTKDNPVDIINAMIEILIKESFEPSHAGNTWSDMSATPQQWLIDRPRHISRVIDHILADADFSSHIHEDKIGVYGFSAGGYTALGLIGGVPDLAEAATHCEQYPQEYVCEEGLIDAMLAAEMSKLPTHVWGVDTRVTAASIAAPGFAFAYTEASLQAVSADVQIWSGQLDEQVPTASNAALLAQRLPVAADTHWVDDANHFAFLVMPCRDAFEKAEPEEYEIVCGDVEGFDRHVFHDIMHVEMVKFFKRSFDIR